MVNIIRMRQEEREIKLRKIEGSLRKAIVEGQNISYDKTLMAVTANIPISRRTAIEYLDIVLFRLGMKREDLDKDIFPEVKAVEEDAQNKLDFILGNKKDNAINNKDPKEPYLYQKEMARHSKGINNKNQKGVK